MENSISAEPVAESQPLMTLSQWIDLAIRRATAFTTDDDFWQGYHFAITELKLFLESRQDNE